MTSKLIYPVAMMLLLSACGGRSGARGAAEQQYETVQEGSANGVTSTIQGPGETLPPITGTDADTTTAFALNPNVAPGGASTTAYPTSSVAPSTMPPPMYSGSTRPASPPVQSQPAPVQSQAQPTTAPPTPTAQPTPQPEQPPQQAEPQPPPQQVEPEPPTNTDTTATTPPPAEGPAEEPETETAEEPAPPPPAR